MASGENEAFQGDNEALQGENEALQGEDEAFRAVHIQKCAGVLPR